MPLFITGSVSKVNTNLSNSCAVSFKSPWFPTRQLLTNLQGVNVFLCFFCLFHHRSLNTVFKESGDQLSTF